MTPSFAKRLWFVCVLHNDTVGYCVVDRRGRLLTEGYSIGVWQFREVWAEWCDQANFVTDQPYPNFTDFLKSGYVMIQNVFDITSMMWERQFCWVIEARFRIDPLVQAKFMAEALCNAERNLN